MSTYSDTIAASKRSAEQRQASENAEAMEKARARQKAREFLKAVVVPELEQARQDLHAAGVASTLTPASSTSPDSDSADGADGTLRCTLTIEYPRGGTGTLIFAADAGINSLGVEPVIVFKKGEQYDGTDIEMSRPAVVEKIKAALTDLF